MIKLSAALLVLGLTLALPAQDTVRLRNGNTETGTIESENYDGIVMKAKKGNQERNLTIAPDDVASISYDKGAEYQKAVNLVSTNLGNGISQLQALSGKKDLRKLLVPAVLFQLGSAQQRAGQFAAAAATQQDLIKSNPKTRYLIPAVQCIVDSYLALGDAAGGAAAVEAAASSASQGGVDVSYMTAFDYFRGKMLEAQKDLVGAKVKYQAATSATKLPVVAALARVSRARCEQQDGKADQARQEYKAIADQPDAANEVLAAAWNGLADLSLADGAKDRKAEGVMNALYMYLRGVVEYAPAPGEATGEYERALAGAAQAFKQLSELETDDAKQKQWAQKSRQHLDQLKKEFPNSRYLK
jgi:hypothetical protein